MTLLRFARREGSSSVLGSDRGVSLAQLEKAEPKGEQEPPSKPQ